LAGRSRTRRGLCPRYRHRGEDERIFADDKIPLANKANYDALILWLAFKEAKALLGVEQAQPAKALPEME
jgi:hypothetical protein